MPADVPDQPPLSPPSLSVCVYCGSRSGARPAYLEAARALGRAIGESAGQLVYGGGRVGLMGEVADAVLAAGGRVIGVIPESLMKREVGHRGLHELHVVATMHQRKQMMAERADVFVALPGGIGTLEEFYEVWSWRQLGYHDQPIGLADVDGYYEGLWQFMQRAADEGFVDRRQLASITVDADPARLLERLTASLAQSVARDDFRRI